jgi:hypothetical protein
VSKELDQYALDFKRWTLVGIGQGQRTGRRVCLYSPYSIMTTDGRSPLLIFLVLATTKFSGLPVEVEQSIPVLKLANLCL